MRGALGEFYPRVSRFFCSIQCLILLYSQNRLQRGYIAMAQSLPWIHEKLAKLDVDDADDMLKKVRVLNGSDELLTLLMIYR
jgi:hypothetical protein